MLLKNDNKRAHTITTAQQQQQQQLHNGNNNGHHWGNHSKNTLRDNDNCQLDRGLRLSHVKFLVRYP